MDLEQAMQEIFYHGFVFTLRPKKALEALKVIRKTLLDYEQLKVDYIDIDKQLRTANTEIDRLQSVSSWIPCSERKPDDDSYNWAVGITSSGRCIAFQEHNAYKNDTGGISVPTYLAHGSEITHWMPLPKTPQRKDDTHDND